VKKLFKYLLEMSYLDWLKTSVSDRTS